MFLTTLWGFSPIQIIVFLALLLLFIIELFYLFAIYNSLYRYTRRAQAGGVSYLPDLPPVSVVVYAHDDEAEGLHDLLPILLQQEYPCYEVIVVNDRASFEVQNMIALYECEHKNLYQTAVPETVYNVSRKKLGITLGVKAAKHDIIILTEACCKPQSNSWLSSIARNFVPGVDVVLGHTRMVAKDGSQRRGFASFDRMLFALRYLAYAVIKKPYMGMGCNMAYRRSVFFDNKGFSATLNLHYGDDDLLINEIAHGGNTRVELSQESLVDNIREDVGEAWNELRARYHFTSKYLHTSSRSVYLIEDCLHLLFVLSFAVAMALLLPGVIAGLVPAIIALAAVIVSVLLWWLIEWRVYRRIVRLMGEPVTPFWVPLYQLFRPFYRLYCSLRDKGNKKSNFTWQHLR